VRDVADLGFSAWRVGSDAALQGNRDVDDAGGQRDPPGFAPMPAVLLHSLDELYRGHLEFACWDRRRLLVPVDKDGLTALA
jgi:hypothetical protein